MTNAGGSRAPALLLLAGLATGLVVVERTLPHGPRASQPVLAETGSTGETAVEVALVELHEPIVPLDARREPDAMEVKEPSRAREGASTENLVARFNGRWARLDVGLLTDAGGPWTGEATLQLITGLEESVETRESKDARSTFRFVPPGMVLELRVRTPFHERVRWPLALLRPGEERRVEVLLGPARCELVGRLVAASWGPLLETDFMVIDGRGRARKSYQCRTDASGQFRCLVVPVVESGDEVQFQVGEEAWARLRLPAGEGRFEVGDVQLIALPVLVSGELRFPNGERLGGAILRYRDWRTWADDDGRFTLRGLADEPEIEVGVERWTSFDPLHVVPGTVDRVFAVTKTKR